MESGIGWPKMPLTDLGDEMTVISRYVGASPYSDRRTANTVFRQRCKMSKLPLFRLFISEFVIFLPYDIFGAAKLIAI